jgi:hypothetical protein
MTSGHLKDSLRRPDESHLCPAMGLWDFDLLDLIASEDDLHDVKEERAQHETEQRTGTDPRGVTPRKSGTVRRSVPERASRGCRPGTIGGAVLVKERRVERNLTLDALSDVHT